MDKVVKFPSVGVPLSDVEYGKGTPNPALVAGLEAILVKAKSGELQALAVAMLIEGGHIDVGFVPPPTTSEKAATMLGCVAGLQATLIGEMSRLQAIETMKLAGPPPK